MRTISKIYFIMTRTLRALDIVKVTSLPKVRGLIYTLFSKLANYYYKKIKGIVLSEFIDETNSIISLTTYGVRTNKVYITLDSIFSQSVRPYKVILWLSEEEYSLRSLPVELKSRMEKYDFFEVRFCEDLKPHKKYYYSMALFPENNIITADDDVFYPHDWLATLITLHRRYPSSIACNNAHKITTCDGSICPYDDWFCLTSEQGPSLLLCPIGVGGVLYPPYSLHKDVFRKDIIRDACLNADDLWLRTMGMLNETTVVNSNRYSYTFLSVEGAKATALSNSNVIGGRNDIQLQNILTIYGDQINKILFK